MRSDVSHNKSKVLLDKNMYQTSTRRVNVFGRRPWVAGTLARRTGLQRQLQR